MSVRGAGFARWMGDVALLAAPAKNRQRRRWYTGREFACSFPLTIFEIQVAMVRRRGRRPALKAAPCMHVGARDWGLRPVPSPPKFLKAAVSPISRRLPSVQSIRHQVRRREGACWDVGGLLGAAATWQGKGPWAPCQLASGSLRFESFSAGPLDDEDASPTGMLPAEGALSNTGGSSLARACMPSMSAIADPG